MAELLGVVSAVRTFGPDAGLFGLDLSVGAGQIHALVGLNGAGKTTLMRAILGMLRLTSGSIHIDNVPLARVSNATCGRVGHFASPTATAGVNVVSLTKQASAPDRRRFRR